MVHALPLTGPAKGRMILAWALQALLAAAFLAAGGSKLLGAEPMVQLFDAIGIGQWFRYLTGLVEISGAVLLLIPGLAGFGGALLAVTMAGAVITHLFVIGGSPVPALVLFVLASIVVSLRRTQLLTALGR